MIANAIVFGVAAFAVAACVVIYYLAVPGGGHHAPRPPARLGGVTRAGRRALGAVRGLPGTTRRRGPTGRDNQDRRLRRIAGSGRRRYRWPAPPRRLTPDDAATVTWLAGMRGLRHPAWTTYAIRARLAVLATITNVPGRDGKRPDSPHTARGNAPVSTTRPDTQLSRGPGHPAGGPPLPSRGDAQGRDVRVCADDSRPAPGADLTGSLSPRPHQEGTRVASAPPPGPTGTRLLGADRLAAEIQATRPWPHDTVWFTMPAIDADVAKAGA